LPSGLPFPLPEDSLGGRAQLNFRLATVLFTKKPKLNYCDECTSYLTAYYAYKLGFQLSPLCQALTHNALMGWREALWSVLRGDKRKFPFLHIILAGVSLHTKKPYFKFWKSLSFGAKRLFALMIVLICKLDRSSIEDWNNLTRSIVLWGLPRDCALLCRLQGYVVFPIRIFFRWHRFLSQRQSNYFLEYSMPMAHLMMIYGTVRENTGNRDNGGYPRMLRHLTGTHTPTVLHSHRNNHNRTSTGNDITQRRIHIIKTNTSFFLDDRRWIWLRLLCQGKCTIIGVWRGGPRG
jgi:hypothetical protein